VSDRSDSELIEESLDRPAAFDEIFSRYSWTVFGFIARRVGRGNAADLTGEVFARAFAARARFDLTRTSARPWLLGIADHVCVDHLRRSGVRRRRNQVAAGWLLPPLDEASRTLDDAEARRLRPALERALRRLPERDRQALLLQAVQELSYGEIAEILDVPVGTVRSTLNRARARMRELLGPDARTLFTDDPESGT